MPREQSLLRSSTWLLFSRLTAQGLALLFVVLIARRLGLTAFGQFTFIAAIVLIGNTFTNFGTDTYIVREIARARRVTSLVGQAFGLQLALSALWWLATLLLKADLPLQVYSLILFPLAVQSVATATVRAFERMDLVWVLSLANGVVQVLAAWVSQDVWSLCLSLLVGQTAIAVLSIWVCSRSLEGFRLFPVHDFRPLLRTALPFAALTILLVVSQRLGILSVSTFLGDAATGLFSSVTRVVEGLKLGHYAVLGALLPVIARRNSGSRRSFQSGFRYLAGMSLLMAAGLALFARIVILLLYGEGFEPAIPLLGLLGWSLVPYTISSFISYDLIARGEERTLVKATAVSLAGFLALYLWLVPVHQLQGAIYASLLGELVQAMLFISIQRSSLRNDPVPSRGWL